MTQKPLLRVEVGAVSRSRCIPQLESQFFVITGEAVTSRSRSPPILMEWQSEQCGGFTKVDDRRWKSSPTPPTV